MQISLYGDVASQPARAVWILAECEKERIGNWEKVEINLSKMEQYDPKYKQINPIGKVPAMKISTPGGQDFNMFESIAIMKYLCSLKNLPDHWYPTSANRDIKL